MLSPELQLILLRPGFFLEKSPTELMLIYFKEMRPWHEAYIWSAIIKRWKLHTISGVPSHLQSIVSRLTGCRFSSITPIENIDSIKKIKLRIAEVEPGARKPPLSIDYRRDWQFQPRPWHPVIEQPPSPNAIDWSRARIQPRQIWYLYQK